MTNSTATTHQEIEVLSATAAEGSRHYIWKGKVVARINGLKFTHWCEHTHRKPNTAAACAEEIAAELVR